MKYIKSLILVTMCLLIGSVSYAQSGEFTLEANELEVVNKIDIYPNPSVDVLNVKIVNSKMSNPQLVVYNILGSKVDAQVESLEDGQFRIKVADLLAGYYLLSIEDDNTQFKELHKFLKR